MSFLLCDGKGSTKVPCTGCVKNPCEALEMLRKAEAWLNEQPCSMALDFGVCFCNHRMLNKLKVKKDCPHWHYCFGENMETEGGKPNYCQKCTDAGKHLYKECKCEVSE